MELMPLPLAYRAYKTKLRKLRKLRKLNGLLQYKIPQNVGIEDKIVGPLSLRQLIIIFAGGGISYVIFAITSRIYELNALEYFVISIPTWIALAAALIKVHNVTFTKYILLLLEFSINPKKRMWDHRGIVSLVDPDLRDKAKIKSPETTENAEVGRKNLNLNDLSATLDSGGFSHLQEVSHKDIDNVPDDDLITEAYFGNKREQSSTQNMYWRTRDVQKKKLEILAQIEAQKKPDVTQAPGEKKEVIKPASTQESSVLLTPDSTIPNIEAQEEATPTEKINTEIKVSSEKQMESKIEDKTVPNKDQTPKKVAEGLRLTSGSAITLGPLESKTKEEPKITVIKTELKNKVAPEAEEKKENNLNPEPSEPAKKKETLSTSQKIEDATEKETTTKSSQETKQSPDTIPSEAKTIEAKPQEAQSLEAKNETETNESQEAPKKKRRRRRRKKKTALPVRPETQIDTTAKNQPAKLIPKSPVKDDITLDDLKAGSEIEINLD